MLANVDREVVGCRAVQLLECKTAGEFSARLWRDGVPEYVQLQVQHQLAVTGRQAADVAVLICGQKLEVHRIERDDGLITRLIELEANFWRYVETDTPPPPADGSESADRALRCLYPGAGGTVDFTGDRRLSSIFADLVAVRAEIETRQQTEAQLRQTIVHAMGEADHAQFETGSVSYRRSRDGLTTDIKRLLADHPDLALAVRDCQSWLPPVSPVDLSSSRCSLPSLCFPLYTTRKIAMLKGLAITPPVIGRISIGRVVEKDGKRLPEKDDQFTLTTQVQQRGEWMLHPLNETLRKAMPGKLRAIPIRMLFDDPDLNLRAEYSCFDHESGRPVCVGNGETCRRAGEAGIEELPCPSPDGCAFGQGHRKPYGRLNVLIGDEDEMGSFIFRTTSYNSIRTLAARLHYFSAVSDNLSRACRLN